MSSWISYYNAFQSFLADSGGGSTTTHNSQSCEKLAVEKKTPCMHNSKEDHIHPPTAAANRYTCWILWTKENMMIHDLVFTERPKGEERHSRIYSRKQTKMVENGKN
jgi:hypothetical protein